MKSRLVRFVALLAVAVCPAVAAFEIWSTAQLVRTEDQNGDGHPDVWRRYDNRGRLVQVDVDSNFDGRPDIQEYYEHGSLVRRESDRNFNGQADLVEEFDTETHARTRSVIDIDYDGTGDLLVLFRDGAPVFSKWASARRSADQPAGSPKIDRDGVGRLARLSDPFESDLAVRGIHPWIADSCAGLSPSGGPCASAPDVAHASSTARLIVADPQLRSLIQSLRTSPRAPPVLS